MDGVEILWGLLTGNEALAVLVPTERIAAGVLPEDVELPAISIESISSVDRKPLSTGSWRHVSERVQVTVYAAEYPDRKDITRAVRKAAAEQFPAIDGLRHVTVHTDGAGPDLMNEETSVYFGSQDFRVTYSEPR